MPKGLRVLRFQLISRNDRNRLRGFNQRCAGLGRADACSGNITFDGSGRISEPLFTTIGASTVGLAVSCACACNDGSEGCAGKNDDR
ncbi:hypothetical protein AB664_04330 [Brucella anthropi]|uniref:Uncharacterized protein n=1 Tax=Brucella anthropi TaxID=529 RepID=A0A656Z6N7_BRUAN|nr:hypothetical protein AB664_04330 [Brucella anthropi]